MRRCLALLILASLPSNLLADSQFGANSVIGLAQLDADAALEVVTVGRYASNSVLGLRVFDSASGTLDFEWYPEAPYSSLIEEPTYWRIGDPDGNGIDDILGPGEPSIGPEYPFHWFEGLSYRTSFQSLRNNVEGSDPIWGQADADLSPEVIVQRYSGGMSEVVAIDRDTEQIQTLWQLPGDVYFELRMNRFRDLDGDGFNEIMVSALASEDYHPLSIRVIQTSGINSGIGPDRSDWVPDIDIWSTRPEPTSASVRIEFAVATPQPVSVRILDVSGRLVRQVRDNEVLKVGRHSLDWDGTDRNGNEAPSGVYLVQVAAGGSVDSRRVTLVR